MFELPPPLPLHAGLAVRAHRRYLGDVKDWESYFAACGDDAPIQNVDAGYRARYKHLIIIVSDALEEDGRWWRHASVSRKDKAMPTYEDQDISLGSDRPECPLYTACLRELRDIYGNCGTRPCPVRPACRNWESE